MTVSFKVIGHRSAMDTQIWINDSPIVYHFAFCNHSPDGGNWGYNGSGPAQLAFEILYAYFSMTTPFSQQKIIELTQRYYQRFKELYLAPIRLNHLHITGEQVSLFLEEQNVESIIR